MVGAFMGAGAAPPANQGASGSVGVEDNIQQPGQKRQFLGGLLGGAGGGAGGTGGAGKTGIAGLLGGGGNKVTGPPETAVAAAMGAGASSGLPTCAEDGTVTMTMRQVRSLLTSHYSPLTSRRSIRMALVLSRPMSTEHRAEPMRLLCSLRQSHKTFPASVCKVSRWQPTPSSR
jgi:hypothetical protein